MYYGSKTIEQATSEELLHALITANGIHESPRTRSLGEPSSSSLIAIGADDTAEVQIFDDSLNLLNAKIGVTEANFKLKRCEG